MKSRSKLSCVIHNYIEINSTHDQVSLNVVSGTFPLQEQIYSRTVVLKRNYHRSNKPIVKTAVRKVRVPDEIFFLVLV